MPDCSGAQLTAACRLFNGARENPQIRVFADDRQQPNERRPFIQQTTAVAVVDYGNFTPHHGHVRHAALIKSTMNAPTLHGSHDGWRSDVTMSHAKANASSSSSRQRQIAGQSTSSSSSHRVRMITLTLLFVASLSGTVSGLPSRRPHHSTTTATAESTARLTSTTAPNFSTNGAKSIVSIDGSTGRRNVHARDDNNRSDSAAACSGPACSASASNDVVSPESSRSAGLRDAERAPQSGDEMSNHIIEMHKRRILNDLMKKIKGAPVPDVSSSFLMLGQMNFRSGRGGSGGTDQVERLKARRLPEPLRGRRHAAAFNDDYGDAYDDELLQGPETYGRETGSKVPPRRSSHRHHGMEYGRHHRHMSQDRHGQHVSDDSDYMSEDPQAYRDEMETDYYMEDDEDDQYPPPREKDVVIFGDEKPGSNQYKFILDSIGPDVEMTSAYLWVYKSRNAIGHENCSNCSSTGGRDTDHANETIIVRSPASYTDWLSAADANSLTGNRNHGRNSTSAKNPNRISETGKASSTVGGMFQKEVEVTLRSQGAPSDRWIRINVFRTIQNRLQYYHHRLNSQQANQRQHGHRSGPPHRSAHSPPSVMPSRYIYLSVDCLPACTVNHGDESDVDPATAANGKPSSNAAADTGEDRRPFLVVGTAEKLYGSRARRSASEPPCTGAVCNVCRMHSLYINFSDIGWGDFIVQPPGYHVNFCHGPCKANNMGMMASYNRSGRNYAMVLEGYGHGKPNQTELNLCCAATETSSMSLLYVNSQHSLMYQTLPNMIVQACGCA